MIITNSLYQQSLDFLSEAAKPAKVDNKTLFVDPSKFKAALSKMPKFSEYSPSEYGGWYHPPTKRYIPASYQEHEDEADVFWTRVTPVPKKQMEEIRSSVNFYGFMFWMGFVRFVCDEGVAGIQGDNKLAYQFLFPFVEKIGKLQTSLHVDLVYDIDIKESPDKLTMQKFNEHREKLQRFELLFSYNITPSVSFSDLQKSLDKVYALKHL